MGGIWSFFYPREDLASRQRHRQQQLIIQEIESIEACVYCYLDNRLQTLLLPYASKSYPWDQSCDILPYFRERSESQPKNCYHCLKGSLIDHFSCQILDQIFQKKTWKCQCSEISLGLLTEDSDDDSGDDDDGWDERSEQIENGYESIINIA